MKVKDIEKKIEYVGYTDANNTFGWSDPLIESRTPKQRGLLFPQFIWKHRNELYVNKDSYKAKVKITIEILDKGK